MIWKLLRRNISVWQISGYSVATLVGLIIIMVAVQFYRDASAALNDDSNGIGMLSTRNIVISKPVSLSATLTGEAPVFSDEEIAEISSQPWASGVARFQAADFSVRAGVELGDRAMHTALFLESVPDSLLDIDTRLWSFDPGNPSVPIVISKDYLALYNFGFASSGNMPMISEGMLSAVPLQITLGGNGRSETLSGRIVGYSTWLNTVAVPQAFMDWAHSRFGSTVLSDPSRLVVTVSDPSDPSIDRFLSDRSYEIAGPGNDLGHAAYFLRLLASVIASVGLVITALALGILMLSLFLLVQKNRRSIRGLLLLGYSPANVSACYNRLVCFVNVAVTVAASIVLCVVAPLWQRSLSDIGAEGSSVVIAMALGFGLMFFTTLINICVIHRLVKKTFMLN